MHDPEEVEFRGAFAITRFQSFDHPINHIALQDIRKRRSQPINHFLLITAAPEYLGEKRYTADDVITWRLKHLAWPLYGRTRNKQGFQPSDKLLFYAGSKKPGGGFVTHAAEVAAVKPNYNEALDCEDFLNPDPSSIIQLTSVEALQTPVRLLDVLATLDCRPKNLRKWGVIVIGGARKLSEDDYRRILFASEPQPA